MDFGAVSWLGVAVGTVAFFAIGGIWYGPLFGRQWMALSGMTQDRARESNMAVLFGGTLVLTLLSGIGLAAVIGEDATPAAGLGTGAAVAVLFVVAGLAVMAMYERKPPLLFALNAGYNLLGFLAMGAIIGAFQ